MGHHHHEYENSGNRSLLIATGLNVLITIAEVVGGILANSLALLSDALHNLSDTIAILMAYIAGRISKRKSNERKTFGYKRIEILSAFLNAIILVGISVFLVYEAIHRFLEPQPVKGLLMLIVAVAGLLFNLLAMLILRRHSSSSLNIRSAYLHLLADTFSSVAVIIGGILIYFFEITWVDPVITILISIYIIKETWDVLRESFNILMQAAPEGMDLKELIRELESIDGIANVHHVHVWGMSEKNFHFECHADLEKDIAVSRTSLLKDEMEKILREGYKIGHLTVQFEFDECDNKNLINGA